ncbi:MAG: GGDEF domain-containing protein [Planctomycetota bacterium]
MGDGLRSIRIATLDDSVLASARAAVDSARDQSGDELSGWEVEHLAGRREIIENPPVQGDLLLIDAWLPTSGPADGNVYELLRQLSGRTKCRTFLLVEDENGFAEPIARFCGATGVLTRPLSASKLRNALGLSSGPRPSLASDGRGALQEGDQLPAALLEHLATSGALGDDAARTEPHRDHGSERREALMQAVIDPVTGLFNFEFLSYKLDEEFKRARRFNSPLACAMLGFESQASDDVLRDLSSIFLEASRDTDVLGRFDENSFLFLLPNTGPDGAEIMARRVADTAEERGLLDLVGDRIDIAIGIGNYPSPDIERRDELYVAAREAFLEAREAGGGVVVCAL